MFVEKHNCETLHWFICIGLVACVLSDATTIGLPLHGGLGAHGDTHLRSCFSVKTYTDTHTQYIHWITRTEIGPAKRTLYIRMCSSASEWFGLSCCMAFVDAPS